LRPVIGCARTIGYVTSGIFACCASVSTEATVRVA